MNSKGWDEIKRLAQDLQRVQLAESTQRLSERNCIEITGKLLELDLLEVYYTMDGKEYITPAELGKEIKEELIFNEGRIELVQLQQALNVDFQLIEAKANDLVKSDSNLTLVLGQLITREYLDKLAEDIAEQLDENGIISVAEIAKQVDLPSEFLHEMIQEKLGSVLKAVRDDIDKNIYYTQGLIENQVSSMRGVFTAITRPTTLGAAMSRYNRLPHLVCSVLSQLQANGGVMGTVTGGKTTRSTFLPECFTRSQTEWIDNFYRQNGYLEYDTLSRLGIADSKNYVTKRLKTFGEVELLESCCISSDKVQQIEAEMEECLAVGSWFDAKPSLPSVCNAADASYVLQLLTKNRSKRKEQPGISRVVLCTDSIVVGEDFITKCYKSFTDLVKSKAEKDLLKNPNILLQYGNRKGGNRQGAATAAKYQHQGSNDTSTSSASGNNDDKTKKKSASNLHLGRKGFMGGREVKTKSSTKKRPTDNQTDDGSLLDEDEEQLEFMSLQELEIELCDEVKNPHMRDCPNELVLFLCDHLKGILDKEYAEELKNIFIQTVTLKDKDTDDSVKDSESVVDGNSLGARGKKQAKHNEMMVNKISSLWINITLYEKSLKLFNEEIQSILSRHLIQTLCTELSDYLLGFLSSDETIIHSLTSQAYKPLSMEVKAKLLSTLKEGGLKQSVVKLQETLNGKSLDSYVTCIEEMSEMKDGQLSHLLKKLDKKKERQLVFNHRQALMEQVRGESISVKIGESGGTDVALFLHMCVTLVVQTIHQCMIHAPGRAVPLLISYLQPHLPAHHHQLLSTTQELVMKYIQASRVKSEGSEGIDDVANENLCRELSERMKELQDISLSTKKSTSAELAG